MNQDLGCVRIRYVMEFGADLGLLFVMYAKQDIRMSRNYKEVLWLCPIG